MSETSDMDNQPIRDEGLLEAIEACRPGSDDLADPAMARLVEQMAADPELEARLRHVQQIDAELGVAFRKVAAPEGLQQRLLERLAAAQAEQLPVDQPVGSEDSPEEPAAEPATHADRPRRSRRRWLAVAGSLAVAAGLLVAVWPLLFDAQPLSESVVLDDSLEFFKAETDNPPARGSLVSQVTPPSKYRFSSAILEIRGTRWRWIEDFLGSRGVAYDLLGPGDLKATLYVVVPRNVTGLPNKAPERPRCTTGGLAASAWQQNGLLYVLVVNRGDRGSYQHFLDVPRGPLT